MLLSKTLKVILPLLAIGLTGWAYVSSHSASPMSDTERVAASETLDRLWATEREFNKHEIDREMIIQRKGEQEELWQWESLAARNGWREVQPAGDAERSIFTKCEKKLITAIKIPLQKPSVQLIPSSLKTSSFLDDTIIASISGRGKLADGRETKFEIIFLLPDCNVISARKFKQTVSIFHSSPPDKGHVGSPQPKRDLYYVETDTPLRLFVNSERESIARLDPPDFISLADSAYLKCIAEGSIASAPPQGTLITVCPQIHRQLDVHRISLTLYEFKFDTQSISAYIAPNIARAEARPPLLLGRPDRPYILDVSSASGPPFPDTPRVLDTDDIKVIQRR